jgi:hypothetical protein
VYCARLALILSATEDKYSKDALAITAEVRQAFASLGVKSNLLHKRYRVTGFHGCDITTPNDNLPTRMVNLRKI